MLLWSDAHSRLLGSANVVTPAQLGSLRESAELLEKTRALCDEMVAQTRLACDDLLAKADLRGEERANAEVARRVLDFEESAAMVADRLRHKVAAAVVACFEKMLHEVGPGAGLEMRALRFVREFWQDGPLVFLVSPSNAPLLRAAFADFTAKQVSARGGLNRVRLIVKESGELNECDVILQTNDGLIDGRLNTQMAHLAHIFDTEDNFAATTDAQQAAQDDGQDDDGQNERHRTEADDALDAYASDMDAPEDFSMLAEGGNSYDEQAPP